MRSNGRFPGRGRLLFVVTGLGWGGAETQVLDLAARFDARGWRVGVATLLANAERRNALSTRGIPVHSLGMKRGVPDPRAVPRLAHLIRDFEPSIVHSHMVHANLLTRVTRVVAPVSVLISTGHNVEEGAAWRIAAYRLTDRLADLTTNVSEAAVARAVERGVAREHRIRLVPNGIDLDRFARDGAARERTRRRLGVDERFVWLVVASFERQKDYPNLLDALERVADHPETPLLVAVGDGPLRQEIEADAGHRGLGRAIRFLGARDDVPALMNAADAYVMSSAWEGLPMVLLEAAASRLPIVTTDVGGNSQIVRNGDTGLLVPPQDGEALAGAMRAVMDSTAGERAAMGQRAFDYVRADFGLDNIVDRWEQIYRDLYSSSRQSRP